MLWHGVAPFGLIQAQCKPSGELSQYCGVYSDAPGRHPARCFAVSSTHFRTKLVQKFLTPVRFRSCHVPAPAARLLEVSGKKQAQDAISVFRAMPWDGMGG
jgi:hypothetical protein